jgi:hypothetical protein
MTNESKLQTIGIVVAFGTLIVTLYNYLSTEEHRSIQKDIDKIRLAEMRAKIKAGESPISG